MIFNEEMYKNTSVIFVNKFIIQSHCGSWVVVEKLHVVFLLRSAI